MEARTENERTVTKNRTTVERKSDREIVVTRTFNAPARIVFEAWSNAELFKQWWVPKSTGMILVSCAMDVRTGGTYRLEFAVGNDRSKTMAFFGKYTDVIPSSRIVWTNEEDGDQGSITTATFEEKGGKTLVVVSELFPSKEAADANGGATDAASEVHDQLDALLVTLVANSTRS